MLGRPWLWASVAVLLSCWLVHSGNSFVQNREKRQLSFQFGGFPAFGQQHNHQQQGAATSQPGREQNPSRPQIDLGQILGSVVEGFLNPATQNQNDNLSGAVAGLNHALNPGNAPGNCVTNNGGCTHECRQQGRFARCMCNAGYFLNRDRRTCTDINECQSSNAGCGHICSNTPGSFSCACAGGFTLQRDGRSCAPGGGGTIGVITPGGPVTIPGGGPVVGPVVGGGGAPVLGGGPGGGGGSHQSGGCAVNNGGCQQNCKNRKRGGVICQCKRGFRRHRDRKSCMDQDECHKRNGGCAQQCVNTPGSFNCACPTPGFALHTDGKSCAPGSQPSQPIVQSCSINNGGCSELCQQTFSGVRCLCNTRGYELQPDGRTCKDVNECTVGNGGCSDICNNSDGGYSCSCAAGGQLLPDGRTCVGGGQTGGQSCGASNGGCEHLCRPGPFGGTECGCNNGYQLNNDGRSCRDVNECQGNNGGCQQLCSNQPGSYVCQCQPGFSLVGGNRCQFGGGGGGGVVTTGPPTSGHQSTCGDLPRKNINNNVRIVGGRPANNKDWPFIAALLLTSTGKPYCGSTLINNLHVLTAAHCVAQFKASDIKVRVGEYDFATTTDNSPLDYQVVEIKSHEQYDTKTQENDIAVLRVDRLIAYGEFVKPACLSPPNRGFANSNAMVIGWGTTSYGGSVSQRLMEVQVPVWTEQDCEAAYTGKIFPKMMCAGYKRGGKDSCQGDSGGPLLTQISGSKTWYLIGVVSWGIECARADRPGVYTKVNEYLPWIQSHSN